MVPKPDDKKRIACNVMALEWAAGVEIVNNLPGFYVIEYFCEAIPANGSSLVYYGKSLDKL